MSNEEIMRILQDYSEYFVTNNFVISAFHQIGWWIAKGLAFLTDLCAQLYDWTFGLVDVTEWTPVNQFLNEFKPFISAFIFLTLVCLGFMFILGKHKKHTLLSSILIFMVVTTSSTYVFSGLNDVSILFKDAVAGTSDQENSYKVFNDNLYDLLYIDKEIGLANIREGNIPKYPSLSKKEAELVNINDVINYNSSYIKTDQAKAILKQKIIAFGGENPQLQEISNGWGWNSQDNTDLGNEFYYRYQFNYGTFYLSILALLFLYICLSYKNTRIIWELLTSRILATVFAADMTNNQKVVKVLTAIRDGYYALCFTAITLKLFLVFQSYLQTKTNIPVLGRGIILLFIAWCAIDGANIMEKVTGVDAGLSSASGKLIAAYHMGRGAVHAGTGAINFARQSRMAHDLREQTKALTNMQGDKQPGVNPQEGDHVGGQDNMHQNSSQNRTGDMSNHEGNNQNTANANQYGDHGDTVAGGDTVTGGDTVDNVNRTENGTSEADIHMKDGQANPDGAGMENMTMDSSDNTSGGSDPQKQSDHYGTADQNAKRMNEELSGSDHLEKQAQGYQDAKSGRDAMNEYSPEGQNMFQKRADQRGNYGEESGVSTQNMTNTKQTEGNRNVNEPRRDAGNERTNFNDGRSKSGNHGETKNNQESAPKSKQNYSKRDE